MAMKMMFSDRRFAPLFWTQFWGAFNDNFLKNALVVLITFKGISLLGVDSNSLVALAGGIFILPFFLFSPLAGQICDKYEPSFVIRATKLWECAIVLVAGFGFFTQSYVLLLACLFMLGAQSTFFGPVKYSIIPNLVSEDQLIEGNAFIELGTFIAILAGTILGGIATTVPNSEYWITGGLLVVAAEGYRMSRKVPAVGASSPELRLEFNPLPEISDLWRILRQKVAIFNSTLAISWFWFFGAGILSVLPVFCKSYLGVDSGTVTAFLAMFTLGVGAGSILCEKLSFKRVEIGLVPIGSLGMTIFLLDLVWISVPWRGEGSSLLSFSQFIAYPQAWRFLFDFLMMSIFGGIFIVPLYTLLQERSDPQNRARVIAGNNIMNAVFMVVSSLLLTLFYSIGLKENEIFLVFGLMNVAVAFYIYTVVPEFTLRFWSWVLSHVFYRVRVRGIENLPRDGAFVLAANHVTYIDWLLLAGACKRPARFVMYYKFFDIPFLKTLFRQAKVIPIAGAKENPDLMNRAFETVSRELKEGEVVCIFPEGKLTQDGEMNVFRPGILKIVEKDPVPVVPVAMSGLWGSIFSRKPKQGIFPEIWRRTIEIEFGRPIAPLQLKTEALQVAVQAMLATSQEVAKKV